MIYIKELNIIKMGSSLSHNNYLKWQAQITHKCTINKEKSHLIYLLTLKIQMIMQTRENLAVDIGIRLNKLICMEVNV